MLCYVEGPEYDRCIVVMKETVLVFRRYILKCLGVRNEVECHDLTFKWLSTRINYTLTNKQM